MRTGLAALAVTFLLTAAGPGDRIHEIKWLSSKEAFKKANDKETARWVLLYKMWPR